MKKILIIAKDKIIRETTRLVGDNMKFEPIIADHDEALGVFFAEKPSAVIVFDYDEKNKETKGMQTFKDIKNSATDEVVLRLGFTKLNHSDYLQLPCNLEALKKIFTKKEGKKQ